MLLQLSKSLTTLITLALLAQISTSIGVQANPVSMSKVGLSASAKLSLGLRQIGNDDQPGNNVTSWPLGKEVQVVWPEGPVSCFAAFISERTALTAGHCGPVNSIVYLDGSEIGVVSRNLLFEDVGLDVAEITIHEQPIAHLITDMNIRPTIPTPNTPLFYSDEDRVETGRITDSHLFCQRFSINDVEYRALVFTTDLKSRSGMSGAPIYSYDGLVGLVQGGNGVSKTSVSPLWLTNNLDKSKDLLRKRCSKDFLPS